MSSFDEGRLDDLHPEYVRAIEHFEQKKRDTCNETTVITYLNRVTNFCEFLRDEYDDHIPLSAVTEDGHCYPFKHYLEATKSQTNMRSTVITCGDFFRLLSRYDFDVDPTCWTTVEESLPSSTACRDRYNSSDDISPATVGSALMDLSHPVWHALFLCLFKALLRVGEVSNIRLSEIHIQDPDWQRVYDALDVELHPSIRHKPDSLFIDHTHRGNKREVNTIIPIDDELKTALLRALAVRPTTPRSLDDPVFFASHSTNYGLKLSPSSISQAFQDRFVDVVDDIPDEMTPHDCRHWGSRQFRATNTDNEIVLAYIRGDTDESVRDQYDNLLADWENRVRRPYERDMPSLYF